MELITLSWIYNSLRHVVSLIISLISEKKSLDDMDFIDIKDHEEENDESSDIIYYHYLDKLMLIMNAYVCID